VKVIVKIKIPYFLNRSRAAIFSGTTLGSELFKAASYLRVRLIFFADGCMHNNPIAIGVGLFLEHAH